MTERTTLHVDEATRQSSLPKAAGTARFVSDIYPEKALVGAIVRSPLPHCRIHSIDVRKAKAIPGVRAVFTADDIPGWNIIPKPYLDQPLLASEKARSVLDALVLIAADDQRTARLACEAVELDLEPLPAVCSIEEALAPDAPAVHKRGNLLEEYHLARGDVERGIEQADVVVEGQYCTPPNEHAYLEPEGGAAVPTGDGGVRIWFGSNSVYVERDIVATVLDLPIEKVEIIQPYIGGVFGGRNDGLLPSYLALLALHTGRPVRIAYSREELFSVTTKRHPQWIRVRTGAKRDGRLTAAAYEIVFDTGAYAHWGPAILLFCSIGAPGPYRIPNVRVDSKVVYTNNVTMGAMRSWGMPGVTFATESQLDRLACELGIHPLVLRWINAAEDGDEIITGQTLPAGVGLKATIAAAARDQGVQLPE